MIHITNGMTTLQVSKGAFKELYSKQGFVLAGDAPEVLEPEVLVTPTVPAQDTEDEAEDEVGDTQTDEEESDEYTLEELSEIPLSEMNFDTLRAYAALKGISTEGMRTKREIRLAIKATEE